MSKKYFLLHPSVFKLDGGAMFGIIPKPLWSKFIQADELNRIQLSLRVMLIQTPHKNILIDTGIGDYHGDKFDDRFGVEGPQDPLTRALKDKVQLDPSDITDLVITHLHFDHAGGLGKNAPEPTILFPNARLHIHRQHYDYALNPTLRDTGSFQRHYFQPLIEKAIKENKVHWLEGNEGELLSDGEDKLFFKCSFGHTPYLMHPYDEKFIYMADLVPTSIHIPVPWVMGYDISPGQTTVDKVNFYDFITNNNLTMIFEHDMKIWGAKLTRSEKDFSLKETFLVSHLNDQRPEVVFE